MAKHKDNYGLTISAGRIPEMDKEGSEGFSPTQAIVELVQKINDLEDRIIVLEP